MDQVYTNGKFVRVVMEFLCTDGTLMRRELAGDQAEEWNKCLGNVCVLAHTHNMNPDWTKFRWRETVIKRRKRRKP